MRHIFDQYSQPENRITHALISGLAQDSRLLRKFVQWITGKKFLRGTAFNIVEQSLPGEIQTDEENAEERGLPDAWIYTEDGWALLIESKISAHVLASQLTRHLRIAQRRGFPDSTLLVLATEDKIKRLPNGTAGLSWRQVYKWLCRQSDKHGWARHIQTYMEIAEAKMVQMGYLKEGTITRFAGIPFTRDYPFNYLEAKRLLGLIMDELKTKKSLQRLGVDPKLPGRGAIKSHKGWSVWDFMRLKYSKNSRNFTKYPHFTVAILADKATAFVTLPNAAERIIRKRLFGCGQEVFNNLMSSILEKMKPVFKIDPSVQPYAQVIQRHYLSQSSPPIQDAILRYDLRTITQDGEKVRHKYQPQWLETTYEVMTNKKSNIQFEIGIEIPYRESRIVHTTKAITLFEEAFLALQPFLKQALDRNG